MVANPHRARCASGSLKVMVLAAGPGGKDIFLLEPHAGAQPGMAAEIVPPCYVEKVSLTYCF